MIKFGIDISLWQGDIDLKQAVREGVTFAILKGGGADDGLYRDGKLERNYAAAKANKLPVGIYWFSKAVTQADAVAEAEFFYSAILKGKTLELPVFIDVEHKQMLNLDKNALTAVINKWCEYLEKKGCWVGVYASVDTFRNKVIDSKLPYTHWVAQWSDKCTYENKDVMGFWQFGGDTNLIRSNTIAGVVCDQNYMYRDFPTLIKNGGFNGFAPPPPDINKSIDDIAWEVIAGKWGNGAERKNRLELAGYSYQTVQARVDMLLKGNTNTPANQIKAGDMAKMLPDAKIYGTDKPFAAFVYNTLLYVRELTGSRAVVSTTPDGPVTGAVHIKYLNPLLS